MRKFQFCHVHGHHTLGLFVQLLSHVLDVLLETHTVNGLKSDIHGLFKLVKVLTENPCAHRSTSLKPLLQNLPLSDLVLLCLGIELFHSLGLQIRHRAYILKLIE